MNLTELQHLVAHLKRMQEARVEHDLNTSTRIEVEYQQLIEQNNRRLSELKIDQAIRRGEETVLIWNNNSIPFGVTQNGARVIREQKLAELNQLDEQELANLQAEFVRLENEAISRNGKYLASVEKDRDIEDFKAADHVSKLSGGKYSPPNMLGMVVVIEKMLTNIHVQANAELTLANPFGVMDEHGIGSAGPSALSTPKGINAGHAVSAMGLQTPENTPPSNTDARFPTSQVPATPTHAPKKRVRYTRSTNQSAGDFGPAILPVAANIQTPLPSSTATAVKSNSTSRNKIKEVVVIDLVSESEDDSPPSKRQQLTSTSTTTTDATVGQAISTPRTTRKTLVRVAKKPIVSPVVNSRATSKNADVSVRVSVKNIFPTSKNITKKPEALPVLSPVREKSPGIWDSDSDYSETENTKKNPNRASPLETTRSRSGKLLMGDLLDVPGSVLSFAKGPQFKTWARRVYTPQKLTTFSVNYIWTHGQNGKVSIFDDETHPLGFYFRRSAHTCIPIIGHAKKDVVHPEFVLEESEMDYIQYNSEHALVCIAKNVAGPTDVVVKFGSRAELWDFLVVTNMEMGVRIVENVKLNIPKVLPKSWFI
ncbi:hypothetical protein VTL71DRAFT_618 [Oculimacula yallundae]|uniref:Uncharacterized protein n=1 Tax=Oculimacula yallundae TaxID=86028 RepID=A0ABR4D0N8_9HELO